MQYCHSRKSGNLVVVILSFFLVFVIIKLSVIMDIMSKLTIFRNNILVFYNKYWWLTPLTIFLIWRILLELMGQYFYWINISDLKSINYSQNIWWHWDSGWYGSIANNGYILKSGLQSNVTFFPLYPLLWKIIATITGLPNYFNALLVSNTLALGSFIIFYRWLSIVWGNSIARRGLIALAVFPTSFFLISAYSESTLLFLIGSIFILSEKGKWKLAAVSALLASAARPVGIFLWPVLFGLWFYKTKNTSNRSKSDLYSILILPPLGMILFSLFFWFKFDDPLLWLHGQQNYGRNFVLPPHLIYAYLVDIVSRGEFWLRHLAEISALFLAIVCLPKLKKIHPVYALFVVLNILPSLFSNTLTSIQRFVLILLPIYIIIAKQNKIVYFIYLFLSVSLLIFSVNQFVNFNWVS